jgi:hypothetical protein
MLLSLVLACRQHPPTATKWQSCAATKEPEIAAPVIGERIGAAALAYSDSAR